jgi:hypothetical protein
MMPSVNGGLLDYAFFLRGHNMSSLTLSETLKKSDSQCIDVLALAERELAAFFGAVKELFGPEIAEQSAQDWLRELEASNSLPASSREWRLISTRVMARFAGRASALYRAN